MGTSEVEMVLATQCLMQHRPKKMRITVDGTVQKGVTAKDIVLYVISKTTAAGGTGYFVEFAGSAFRDLTMEGRMTVCNMSIEMGARGGLIAPDQTTFDYIEGRPYAPKGEDWDKAIEFWKSLPSDANAKYDKEINIEAEEISPQITWGTSPQDVVPINGKVPNPENIEDLNRKKAVERSLEYMGLEADQEIEKIKIDKVFIGSCTNGRIEDLREVARVVEGKKVSVDSMIVPGSGLVKEQAESEGLDKIFIDAGFDWREPGCSMCLAMNPDQLKPKERCASTSNRNFEGRQGREGRTHLVSPVIAAASAIKGTFAQESDL